MNNWHQEPPEDQITCRDCVAVLEEGFTLNRTEDGEPLCDFHYERWMEDMQAIADEIDEREEWAALDSADRVVDIRTAMRR